MLEVTLPKGANSGSDPVWPVGAAPHPAAGQGP